MGICGFDECNNEVLTKNKYCSLSCRNKQVNKTRDYSKNSASLKGKIPHNKIYHTVEAICPVCDNIFTFSSAYKDVRKYCSISCSNVITRTSQRMSEITRLKHSAASKKLWLSEEYREKQVENNSSHNIRFSSIGERELQQYFKSLFPEDKWTFGGSLNCGNDLYVSRDLYSDKLKVCIEYDGIWHFKDIHGQLESKQGKDKALDEWCKDNKWRIIRIREEIYKNNRAGVLKELINFAYNSQETIIKLY